MNIGLHPDLFQFNCRSLNEGYREQKIDSCITNSEMKKNQLNRETKEYACKCISIAFRGNNKLQIKRLHVTKAELILVVVAFTISDTLPRLKI